MAGNHWSHPYYLYLEILRDTETVFISFERGSPLSNYEQDSFKDLCVISGESRRSLFILISKKSIGLSLTVSVNPFVFDLYMNSRCTKGAKEMVKCIITTMT
jgi:hypothetical protein